MIQNRPHILRNIFYKNRHILCNIFYKFFYNIFKNNITLDVDVRCINPMIDKYIDLLMTSYPI